MSTTNAPSALAEVELRLDSIDSAAALFADPELCGFNIVDIVHRVAREIAALVEGIDWRHGPYLTALATQLARVGNSIALDEDHQPALAAITSMSSAVRSWARSEPPTWKVA